MQILIGFGILIASYVLGSIPFGWIIVRLKTGQDLRSVASGRTGGTNAFRAAGTLAGIVTGLLDAAKGAFAVWLAIAVLPGSVWIQVLAPLAAVLGHNYSVFMIERDEQGKVRFRGGAGGAPTVGGAFALWPPSLFFIVPIGFLIWYFVGYASLTTICAALVATILFVVRAAQSISPWEYVLYGVLAEILLILSLRPNIQRLIQGNERLVGFRARRRNQDK